MSANVDVTHELAVFLRDRRKRLAPEEVDLPASRRPRRTPGLRREEVAELAGVSVDYVIRLEQGRGLRPSPEVLDALARALRLSDDEHAYLFDLVGHRTTGRRGNGTGDSIAHLVRAMSPLPAMLVDRRFDILAWNPEMAELLLRFDRLPPEQRNSMMLCVLHPAYRDFYRHREQTIREGIADLRAAWAADPEDAALTDLIGTLRSGSEEFARLWERRDVKVYGHGLKALLHPEVGPLTIEFDVLTPLGDTTQRLVVYRPADAPSKKALDLIARKTNEESSALRAMESTSAG
ncbi:helix-turn-helix transcriptional regulator [Actinoallomurus acanthiterrae]